MRLKEHHEMGYRDPKESGEDRKGSRHGEGRGGEGMG